MPIYYPIAKWLLQEHHNDEWICTAHSDYLKNTYFSSNQRGVMYNKRGEDHRDIVEAYTMAHQFCQDIYRKHATMDQKPWHLCDNKDMNTVSGYINFHPYQMWFANFAKEGSIRLDDAKLEKFLARVHFFKSLEPLCRHVINEDATSPYLDTPMTGHERMKNLALKKEHESNTSKRLVNLIIYTQNLPYESS